MCFVVRIKFYFQPVIHIVGAGNLCGKGHNFEFFLAGFHRTPPGHFSIAGDDFYTFAFLMFSVFQTAAVMVSLAFKVPSDFR